MKSAYPLGVWYIEQHQYIWKLNHKNQNLQVAVTAWNSAISEPSTRYLLQSYSLSRNTKTRASGNLRVLW
jgi:hypothetical protein